MRRYKITRKTKAVQREIDRDDDPLDTLEKTQNSYNSYNIVTCTLTSVSGFFFVQHDGVLVLLQLLVVIAVLCAIMLIIKYQLALASVKIRSQIVPL